MRKTSNEELCRPTAEEYQQMKKMPVTVVLDNVRSMNNVGSFFRTGDAFGIESIWLCGITGCPPAREIHKTALGAESTVRWEYAASTCEVIDRLRSEGYEIWAVEQAEKSVQLDCFDIEPGRKYALIFGNEVDGVSQEAVDMCDNVIEIPQVGTKHSLNVSVAGGVVMWEVFLKYRSLNR